MANALPLCGHHHRRAHDSRVTMTLLPSREARFKRRRTGLSQPPERLKSAGVSRPAERGKPAALGKPVERLRATEGMGTAERRKTTPRSG
jgi:hypothetical protein